MGLGHALMFVGMVSVMLRRVEEYTGRHHDRSRRHVETDRSAAAAPRSSVRPEI